MEEIYTKNLIIGAGISGLTLAYYLKDDFLILEKEKEVGGYCRTIKNSKYVWDYAGHFYHFKTDKFKKLFLSMIEPKEIIEQNKITKIYYKNRLIDFPFQMNIHQLEKEEFCDCLYDLYFKNEKDIYDNFLDMLYGKFGTSIVEKFLRPYNEKLYATDLKKLDKDAMGRFFPYADFEAILKNMKSSTNSSYNDHFLYLKKGTQYFIDRLKNKIDNNKIRLNSAVISINTKDKYVLTSDNCKIHYESLINTSPLNHFFKYFNDSSLTNLTNKMSYNKVLVQNLGFNRASKRYKTEHWVYFPDKMLNFYRVGFYNNILGTDKLSLYVEVGYSKDEKINEKQQLKETLKNLVKAEIIDSDTKLVDRSIIIMDPGYVHISDDTEKHIESKISNLNKKNIYTIGRYGKWTYCSMEDCMIWAEELAEKLQIK